MLLTAVKTQQLSRFPPPKRWEDVFPPAKKTGWIESYRWKGPSKPARKRRPLSVWVQRKLTFRNDPPLRRSKKGISKDPTPPLWMHAAREWTVSCFQRGEGRTAEALALLFLIRLMRADCVLYCKNWRLELVWLGEGYPHYRLYWKRYLYGVEDIPVNWGKELLSSPKLRPTQNDLAAYLVICGFRAETTTFVAWDARTPINASKDDLPRLFEMEEKKKGEGFPIGQPGFWHHLDCLYAQRTLAMHKQLIRIHGDAY